jgi:hypothetical protein
MFLSTRLSKKSIF